jgi:hypothetical protein
MFSTIRKRLGLMTDTALIVHSYSLSGGDYIVRCPHCHRPTNLLDKDIFGKDFRHAVPGYPDIGCGGLFKVSRKAEYFSL